MNRNWNHKLTRNSQILRIHMTREERHLWYDFLKGLPLTVTRQKVVGNYILDFYISDYKIAIEIDGSQHFEKMGKEKDTVRDRELIKHGIRVLRYSNYDINTNFDGVCMDIAKNIELYNN